MSTRRPTFTKAAESQAASEKETESTPAVEPEVDLAAELEQLDLEEAARPASPVDTNVLKKSTDEISRRLSDLKEEVTMAALMESCSLEEVEGARAKVEDLEARMKKLIREANKQMDSMRSAIKALEDAHSVRQQLESRVQRILSAFDES